MKNNNNGLIRTVLFSCFVLTLVLIIVTGCGGSNNPAGPSDAAGSAAAIKSDVAVLDGFIVDAATGDLVDNAQASIQVTAEIFGGSFKETKNADNNRVFSFDELSYGYYTITIRDLSGVYLDETIIKEIDQPREELRIQIEPVTPVEGSRLNFYGKLLEPTHDSPVMFANVKVTSAGGAEFETSTLANGNFSLTNLASGTYDVVFSKTSFETISVRLLIGTDRIRFGTKAINLSKTDIYTDGAGKSFQAYDLGEVILSPQWKETGAIAGVLLDDNNNPYPTNQVFDLVYSRALNDANPPRSIIKGFQTNDSGYFFAKNLPVGWYLVAFDGYVPEPIFDVDNVVIAYEIATASLAFDVWLEVLPGQVTPVPVMSSD